MREKEIDFHFLCSKEFSEKIKKVAKENGLNASAYIRLAIIEKFKREEK